MLNWVKIMVKNKKDEVKRILEDISEKIANRMDDIIYMNLMGFVCQLHINGENYPIKVRPTKFQKFMLKLIGWEVWEF